MMPIKLLAQCLAQDDQGLNIHFCCYYHRHYYSLAKEVSIKLVHH